MLFTSYEFIGFLIAVFVLYYLMPKKAQWPFLLVASLFFYGCASPYYLIFIIVTGMTTYVAARGMGSIADAQSAYIKEHKAEMSREERKAYKAIGKKKIKWIFLACLLLNLGILAVLKYTNFTIANINGIAKAFTGEEVLSFVDIVLPMGISFYTFQTMSYLIDVYRGKQEPEKNPAKLMLFVSFFPQLVQGPISRFSDLSQSLFEYHRFNTKTVAFGLQRILWGFFKKMVVADRIIVAVKTIIGDPDAYTGVYVFMGMFFYAFELYCDFTGGIDITIGIAETMGIHVKENFERPFFSKNIKEYWNRWHITMGTWFTDYIFYPISVSTGMLKLSKFSRKHFGEAIGKRVSVYLSAFIVWFATGIWHGASWNFIVWGLGNFVVIMISQEFDPLYYKFHKKFNVANKFWFRLFQVLRTVLLMSCLRMFDCYRDVPLTFKQFGTMFYTWNWGDLFNGAFLNLGLNVADYVILIICLVVICAVSLLQRRKGVRERLWEKPYVLRFVVFYGLFLIILVFGAYGIGFDASQFIYNQF